ncbi:hypothetical protein SKAU_G00235000 [Synaphobranchus kaupii]|uniref:Uncharacterized protein n=1 Tax=Synaphobranchus kaupii TaxID=118154 RepID=A0A9Q1F6F6_SYNKA|nr:hypothetical protein SKAU_G00235000 [Synaphobranchus kaupii]
MKKVHVTTVNTDYTGSEPKRSRTAYTRQQHLNKWKLGRDGHHEQGLNEEVKKQINVGNSLKLRKGWENPIT